MYLFNPLYVFSNIIYVLPARRYVLIERQCWNTLVSKVFRGRPSSQALSNLKLGIYELYVVYRKTGKIDHQSFDRMIASLETTPPPSPTTTTSQPTVEVNDELFVEEFYGSEELRVSDTTKKLLDQYGDSVSTIREEATLWLNHFVCISQQHNRLISLIGFGKILNVVACLASTGRYVFNRRDDLLEDFLDSYVDLVYLALRNRGSFWFRCAACKTINCHIRAKNHHPNDSNVFHQDKQIHQMSSTINVTDSISVQLSDYVSINAGLVSVGDEVVNDFDLMVEKVKRLHLCQERDKLKESFYKRQMLLNASTSLYCDLCRIKYVTTMTAYEFLPLYESYGMRHMFFLDFSFVESDFSDVYRDDSLFEIPEVVSNFGGISLRASQSSGWSKPKFAFNFRTEDSDEEESSFSRPGGFTSSSFSSSSSSVSKSSFPSSMSRGGFGRSE